MKVKGQKESPEVKKMKKTLFAMTAVIALLAGTFGCAAKAEEAKAFGGWTAVSDQTITPELQEMFDKAMEKLIGVGYRPISLLETQIVNGTNYKFLCEGTAVYPGAAVKTYIITIHQDLEGNAEILEIEEEGTAQAAAQMANPFVRTDTLDEAAAGAGFSFLAPEEIDGYKISEISYIKDDMIQIIYGNNLEIRVRKSVREDDITGDYNVYEINEEKEISGVTASFKVNADGIHTVSWKNGGYSYAFMAGYGMSEASAEALVQTLK